MLCCSMLNTKAALREEPFFNLTQPIVADFGVHHSGGHHSHETKMMHEDTDDESINGADIQVPNNDTAVSTQYNDTAAISPSRVVQQDVKQLPPKPISKIVSGSPNSTLKIGSNRHLAEQMSSDKDTSESTPTTIHAAEANSTVQTPTNHNNNNHYIIQNESIDVEMQENPLPNTPGSRPLHEIKKNINIQVLSDIRRRYAVPREPYAWLSSRRFDSNASDDSTNHESKEYENTHSHTLTSTTSSSRAPEDDYNQEEDEKHTPFPLHPSDSFSSLPVPSSSTLTPTENNLFEGKTYSSEEWIVIEKFWKAYDEILILSLFSILGILFRLLFAQWFSIFDGVFNEQGALFTNLPLNCFSCWLMGFLCSGNEALDIVFKRMGAAPLTREDLRLRSRTKSWSQPQAPQPPPQQSPESIPESTSPSRNERDFIMLKNKMAQSEMRDVQLLALERRIRASHSLVLFPARKQDIDVIEHYTHGVEDVPESSISSSRSSNGVNNSVFRRRRHVPRLDANHTQDGNVIHQEITSEPPEPLAPINHETPEVEPSSAPSTTVPSPSSTTLTDSWKQLSRVNIADGWDVGTTADAMKDGILLGLRVGFCGAVSSFSSWNSDMVSLLCNGSVDAAIVGYVLGFLVPIVSYRTGQHSAVYVFVWRCRRETLRDEKRGYGLKLSLSGDEDDDAERDEAILDTVGVETNGELHVNKKKKKKRAKNDGGRILDEEAVNRYIPSIRALVTAISSTIIVGFVSSLVFFAGNEAIVSTSWSLLFSPVGGFARRILTVNFNNYFQSFPLGSFACNILGCALSGGLGSVLAGNPNPGQRIALVSCISGFAGSLSAFTSFLIEVLERVDPILLNSDGVIYALSTVFWALIIGIASSQTKDWADRIGKIFADGLFTDDGDSFMLLEKDSHGHSSQ